MAPRGPEDGSNIVLASISSNSVRRSWTRGSWNPLGALLEPQEAPKRAPRWPQEGPRSYVPAGPRLVHNSWGPLGALLELSWGPLGASRGPLGALLGASRRPLRGPEV
eukprot:6022387-Pyramimonas_sp.AAC.1